MRFSNSDLQQGKGVTSRYPKVLTGVSQAIGDFPQLDLKHDWALE